MMLSDTSDDEMQLLQPPLAQVPTRRKLDTTDEDAEDELVLLRKKLHFQWSVLARRRQ
jgi:hypothetical protein